MDSPHTQQTANINSYRPFLRSPAATPAPQQSLICRTSPCLALRNRWVPKVPNRSCLVPFPYRASSAHTQSFSVDQADSECDQACNLGHTIGGPRLHTLRYGPQSDQALPSGDQTGG